MKQQSIEKVLDSTNRMNIFVHRAFLFLPIRKTNTNTNLLVMLPLEYRYSSIGIIGKSQHPLDFYISIYMFSHIYNIYIFLNKIQLMSNVLYKPLESRKGREKIIVLFVLFIVSQGLVLVDMRQIRKEH